MPPGELQRLRDDGLDLRVAHAAACVGAWHVEATGEPLVVEAVEDGRSIDVESRG
jgi:hypothetical protein